MKPIQATILQGKENEVFGTKIVELPYFSTTFHFHEECQLIYVVESEGKRMIGDSVENFGPDELILVGSNVPHVWHNNPLYFRDGTEGAKSVSLFIHPCKLLQLLGTFGNMQRLSHILGVSKSGLKFYGDTKKHLKDLLFKINEQEETFERLTILAQILKILAHTKEFDLLTKAGYTNTYQLKDNDRIDKILKYIFDHFSQQIKLEDVADIVHMSRHAFCRFFKNRTQRTFMEFVTEVRISHACKLIAEGEKQITCLAYECGFNSLSNFNKLFKEVKGQTPSDYRKTLIPH
ncbi:AraC family transcriptional regulator [Olivibacter domesticus]|uniref:AraC-type DNA-binding protein n=1 Tax=Olivibacter domesticus TaxID=407022 RepID=A0A1H7K835_OLID1|nr:AraC family transcriptional regulator [Olivibacter domesticus]SEK82902.1 AraC-type DNA-binding protein [Olivibacter domesticus]